MIQAEIVGKRMTAVFQEIMFLSQGGCGWGFACWCWLGARTPPHPPHIYTLGRGSLTVLLTLRSYLSSTPARSVHSFTHAMLKYRRSLHVWTASSMNTMEISTWTAVKCWLSKRLLLSTDSLISFDSFMRIFTNWMTTTAYFSAPRPIHTSQSPTKTTAFLFRSPSVVSRSFNFTSPLVFRLTCLRNHSIPWLTSSPWSTQQQ